MFRTLVLLPALILIGSCKSPPKPPKVDESMRRPVNSVAVVQLQACRSELQNLRIEMKEKLQAEQAARASVAQAEQRNRALELAFQADRRNHVYAILFAFGSAEIHLSDSSARKLADETRDAPLILLRGRTDGLIASAAESRVARDRAAAVEAWLVSAGVEPARIRATWQPVGDHAADNAVQGGRALNRRVEIEIYRAAPQIVALDQPAEGTAQGLTQPNHPVRREDDHGQ